MNPVKRYESILSLLKNQEMATISELSAKFGISVMTVRRDLNYLESHNMIKKVYGGAILYDSTAGYPSSFQRMVDHAAEKEAIGRRCAEFVLDGDSVFLGPGTTVLQAAKFIKDRKNLSVVTFNLLAAMELLDSDATVYYIGGRINKNSACTEPNISASWDFFHPTVAIIGAVGIDQHLGVTDSFPSSNTMVHRIISNASRAVLVADNSKFGQTASCVYGSVDDFDHIITGAVQKADIERMLPTSTERLIFVDNYDMA